MYDARLALTVILPVAANARPDDEDRMCFLKEEYNPNHIQITISSLPSS